MTYASPTNPSGFRAREDIFRDRRDAGRMLGDALRRRGDRYDVVIGLTRGGVPVAFEVATALKGSLDILTVKKLRAPFNPELAIGAISADGTHILRNDMVREMKISCDYVSREITSRLREAEDADKRYRGGYAALPLTGSSALLVDDGIATGATMEVGVESCRRRGAAKITVATPVGSGFACNALRATADDVFCMTEPVMFWAVGQFYLDFGQLDDAMVQSLLAQGRQAMEGRVPRGGETNRPTHDAGGGDA